MPAFDLIYLTKARALESGLTHEGTMFGVPAWFDGDGDSGMATPKLPVLHLWCIFADFFYEMASYFIPSDGVLVSPIYITGRIK
jgi:hypothetical protein